MNIIRTYKNISYTNI